jgi:hypothetical protein
MSQRPHMPHFARCHRRLTCRCKVTRSGVLYQSRPGGRCAFGERTLGGLGLSVTSCRSAQVETLRVPLRL